MQKNAAPQSKWLVAPQTLKVYSMKQRQQKFGTSRAETVTRRQPNSEQQYPHQRRHDCPVIFKVRTIYRLTATSEHQKKGVPQRGHYTARSTEGPLKIQNASKHNKTPRSITRPWFRA